MTHLEIYAPIEAIEISLNHFDIFFVRKHLLHKHLQQCQFLEATLLQMDGLK